MNAWDKYITIGKIPYELALEDYTKICPPPELIYRAFSFFEPKDTKIVVLAQDPYHTPGKANGLAFGYNKSYEGPVDSSLYNIQVAVRRGTGLMVRDKSLESWAKQGVLLLNTRLTTMEGQPMAHAHLWADIIPRFIQSFSKDFPFVNWLLWGNQAKTYRKYIVGNKVIETSHPCRYSAHRGFNTCDQFQKLRDVIRWGEIC